MNNLDKKYTDLLQDILENGTRKMDRTGTGTISVFGRQIRHKMSEGFPLLTTKKMAWKTMVTELLWFLRGDTNIKFLVDNNCHIWDGDAYKNWCKQFEVDPNNFDAEELVKGHSDQCWGYPILDHVKPTSKEYKRGQINAYLEGKAGKPFFYLTQEEFINKIKTDDEFAKKWGSLGKIYGHGWRNWNGKSDDELYEDYLKKVKNLKSGIMRNKYVNEDGTPYSKAEFLQKLKTDKEFNNEFGNKGIDQISELIRLLKENPDSRRMVVSAWAVHDLPNMVLPPCHYGFQVYTRELSLEERYVLYFEKLNPTMVPLELQVPNIQEYFDNLNIPTRAISLMFNMRSNDVPLGLPFNISSYALLLTIIAKEVNMVPDELIGNLGDCHIYLNQIEGVKEQIGREPYPLPKLLCLDEFHYLMDKELVGEIPFTEKIEKFRPDFFTLENYQSHPSIKMPLSN